MNIKQHDPVLYSLSVSILMKIDSMLKIIWGGFIFKETNYKD